MNVACEQDIKRVPAPFREYPEMGGGEIVPQAAAHVPREVFRAVSRAPRLGIRSRPSRTGGAETCLPCSVSREGMCDEQ